MAFLSLTIPIWVTLLYFVVGVFITALFDKTYPKEFDDFGRFMCVMLWPIPMAFTLAYLLMKAVAKMVMFLSGVGLTANSKPTEYSKPPMK